MNRILLFEFIAYLRNEGLLKHKRLNLATAMKIIDAFEDSKRQESQENSKPSK